MASPPKKKRALAWVRWILFMESLILLLALAGPGSRYGLRRDGDHALLARLFFEEPTYLQAVAVNFVLLHLFMGGAWLLAWLIPRLRRQR